MTDYGGYGEEFNEEPAEDEEKEAFRLAQDTLRINMLDCFGTESGKAVLDYLYMFCRQLKPSFDESSARKTDYNEGKRSVALRIMFYLNLDDEMIIRESARRARKGK